MTKRILPNPSALVDFDAAARWGSFRLAAQELHKTPAAVSQQIKLLERNLGFPLFVRYTRQVKLTEKGAELAVVVARLFGDLNATIERLRMDDDDDLLRVSATHSFAMKWLVPRLPDFTRRYPRIDLRIDSSDLLADLDGGGCDVAIRYQRWQDNQDGTWLLREKQVVVYSPTLFSGQPTLDDLARHTLLCEDAADWLTLLEAAQIKRPRYDFSARFSHAGLVVQAAVAGQGVALVPYAIAHAELAAGRLRLGPCKPLVSPFGYRIMCAPAKAGLAKVRWFEDWLRQEVSAMDHIA